MPLLMRRQKKNDFKIPEIHVFREFLFYPSHMVEQKHSAKEKKMSENGIYKTIAKRTGGDIYIGVVGPVRTGKSTFIHRFLESAVLPNIKDEYDRERTLDEIPQSGSGRTITTTEPKFVPGEAVRIDVDGTELKVRMIDCVGYLVEGAMGAEEEGEARMVVTPWSDKPMPFAKAAEIGTEKVTKEHSTIAMLVTTDGSISDIPRENYIPAEERVAKELKESGKPFAIVLNSKSPETPEAHTLAKELEKKYGVPVALVNCARLNSEDVDGILSLVIGEFPIKELTFNLPEWTAVLPPEHPVNKGIIDKINKFAFEADKFSDIERLLDGDCGIKKVCLDAGCGKGTFDIPIEKEQYYRALSEFSGERVSDDKELFVAFTEMARTKREYDRIKDALYDAREKGYGIVMPTADELTLSEPTLVKQGAGFGIKVSAAADSIHMIKTTIKADVCPALGTEEQSEEVIKSMSLEYDEDPKKLLDSKMFGRTLYEMVNDGMNAKLTHMPDESREKMCRTIEKIINEGASGLICILL